MLLPNANINKRIDAIDILRGFALAGIALHHFFIRFDYIGNTFSSNYLLAKIDKILEYADYHLLVNRTYPIFALLFGFSMFLVGKSSLSYFGEGYSFKRLLALIPFALFNAAIFPAGDILGVYIIAGLFALLLIKLPYKWRLPLSIVFMLQPLTWIQTLASLFNFNINITNNLSAPYFDDMNYMIAKGGFLQIIWTNLTKGLIGNFLWAIEVGRASQTIGLILLGHYLGESGIFIRVIKTGKKSLRYLFIPILIIGISIILKKIFTETSVYNGVLFITGSCYSLAVSFIYVILVIYTYSILPSSWFSLLRFYGRMSLTNYIMQSIIGCIIFAPFALNGAAWIHNIYIPLLFVITITGQVFFSKYWLEFNRYGPLELYWRRLSISLQSIKKNIRSLNTFI